MWQYAFALWQAQSRTGLAAFVTSARGLPLADRIPHVSAGQPAASQLASPARLRGTLTRGTQHLTWSAATQLLAPSGSRQARGTSRYATARASIAGAAGRTRRRPCRQDRARRVPARESSAKRA